MAVIFVNATVIGAPRANGNRITINRGGADGGDITIRVDTSKFTTKGAIRAAVMDMLQTVTDTVK